MATTITKTVVPAQVGPAELAAGCTYVHDFELDGDENLAIGQRVEIRDHAGALFAATVDSRDGNRWRLTIRP
jgi:glycyl-tRNA synthetase (class II)